MVLFLCVTSESAGSCRQSPASAGHARGEADDAARRDGERLQAPEYRVRHAERFALGTTYPVIVDRVEDRVAEPALIWKTRLVVDGTGVGVPVVNKFQQR